MHGGSQLTIVGHMYVLYRTIQVMGQQNREKHGKGFVRTVFSTMVHREGLLKGYSDTRGGGGEADRMNRRLHLEACVLGKQSLFAM